MVILKSNIFVDYAAQKPHRDPIFGMYTIITARNNARYSLLYFLVIRDHRRSLNFTKGQIFKNITQGPNFLHVYSNLHYKLDRRSKGNLHLCQVSKVEFSVSAPPRRLCQFAPAAPAEASAGPPPSEKLCQLAPAPSGIPPTPPRLRLRRQGIRNSYDRHQQQVCDVI